MYRRCIVIGLYTIFIWVIYCGSFDILINKAFWYLNQGRLQEAYRYYVYAKKLKSNHPLLNKFLNKRVKRTSLSFIPFNKTV